jgi:hypothetical protein
MAAALAPRPAAGQTFDVQNGATVQVQNGAVLNLEGATMDLGPTGSTASLDEQSDGRVTGGTLTATRRLNAPTDADPAGLGAVITAEVDLGAVTITRGHTVQTAGGNASIGRYYDIAPAQNRSGLDATLVHTYHDAELNGLAEADLELFASPDGGATWTREGADSRSTAPTGGNTVTRSGIDSFSRWTLASGDNPLPVEMAAFEGTRVDGGVRLSWRTTSETNNAGFQVQRRTGSGSWSDVRFVEGDGTTSDPQTYRFTDRNVPYSADSLSYRLEQVDTGGTVSQTEPVTVIRRGPSGVELLGTTPNPARQHATVRYAIPESVARNGGGVTLQVYDVMGRQVRSIRIDGTAGRHTQRVDVADLASGVYLLRLRSPGRMHVQKMTVLN